MANKKINWWIVVVALIVGLLIGTFLLANLNLFGREVSLGPAERHTHLTDYGVDSQKESPFKRDGEVISVEIPCPPGTVPISSGFNLHFKDPLRTGKAPTLIYNFHDYKTYPTNAYYIGFFDPDMMITEKSLGYVYCAKREPTLHKFGQDR